MGQIEDMLNGMFGGVGGNDVKGKRLVKHDRPWIILAQVTDKLYLCTEGGKPPPCQVMLLRAEPNELIDRA